MWLKKKVFTTFISICIVWYYPAGHFYRVLIGMMVPKQIERGEGKVKEVLKYVREIKTMCKEQPEGRQWKLFWLYLYSNLRWTDSLGSTMTSLDLWLSLEPQTRDTLSLLFRPPWCPTQSCSSQSGTFTGLLMLLWVEKGRLSFPLWGQMLAARTKPVQTARNKSSHCHSSPDFNFATWILNVDSVGVGQGING